MGSQEVVLDVGGSPGGGSSPHSRPGSPTLALAQLRETSNEAARKLRSLGRAPKALLVLGGAATLAACTAAALLLAQVRSVPNRNDCDKGCASEAARGPALPQAPHPPPTRHSAHPRPHARCRRHISCCRERLRWRRMPPSSCPPRHWRWRCWPTPLHGRMHTSCWRRWRCRRSTAANSPSFW